MTDRSPDSGPARKAVVEVAHLVGPGCLRVKNRMPYWQPVKGNALWLHPETLQHVLLYGVADVSGAALRLLWRHDVQVAFLSPHGNRLLGRLQPPASNRPMLAWLQHQAVGDPEFCRRQARRLVQEKIQSQSVALRHYQRQGLGSVRDTADILARAEQSVKATDLPLDSLIGLEGSASRAWHGYMGSLVAGWFDYPGRRAHQATDQILTWIGQGHTWIVETDIRNYFDTISHRKLLNLLRSWQVNAEALRFVGQLIRRGHGWWPRRRGVAQGSPLSPLLANAYLTPFDRSMGALGHSLFRYADDLLVLCADRRQAEQALAAARMATSQVELRLHPDKTRLLDCREASFEFLGFLHAPNFLWPSPANLSKFEREIQHWTDPAQPYDGPTRMRRVDQLVRAFGYYYHGCDVSRLFRRLDAWIGERLAALSATPAARGVESFEEKLEERAMLSGLRQQYLRARRRQPVRWNGYQAGGVRLSGGSPDHP